jgi:hypothetical protein
MCGTRSRTTFSKDSTSRVMNRRSEPRIFLPRRCRYGVGPNPRSLNQDMTLHPTPLFAKPAKPSQPSLPPAMDADRDNRVHPFSTLFRVHSNMSPNSSCLPISAGSPICHANAPTSRLGIDTSTLSTSVRRFRADAASRADRVATWRRSPYADRQHPLHKPPDRPIGRDEIHPSRPDGATQAPREFRA